MATYRSGKWTDWTGVTFYSIEKKTLFGWREENYWKISEETAAIEKKSEIQAKQLMNESIDRLVKAGHTVI